MSPDPGHPRRTRTLLVEANLAGSTGTTFNLNLKLRLNLNDTSPSLSVTASAIDGTSTRLLHVSENDQPLALQPECQWQCR